MNTADLHPKRLPIALTVGQLRELGAELLAMEREQDPTGSVQSADKRLEWERAGEQLATHIGMLIDDTRSLPVETRITDSLPLLRVTAKYLFTACDRCRRQALRQALSAQSLGDGPLRDRGASGARSWDDLMGAIGDQLGVASPARELVAPIVARREDLSALGLGTLINGDDILVGAS